MGYRVGDETVEFEAKVETRTKKAVLVEPTMGPAEAWIPKSQIVAESEPDGDGNIIFTVTEWIAKKNGLI